MSQASQNAPQNPVTGVSQIAGYESLLKDDIQPRPTCP